MNPAEVTLRGGRLALADEESRRPELFAITPGTCLHELFEAHVDKIPGAPALISGDETLTYLELERKVNRLARYLRARGARPGRLVGIYFERSARPIVAILACLKAGAAYIPIDPAYPDERVRHIIRESELTFILTEGALSARARTLFEGAVIDIDAQSEVIRRGDARRLLRRETRVSPGDLCYVIYTSGTTGRPKGVMTEHKSACAFVLAFNEVCATGPGDRVYQGFFLGFDGSVEEIWMAFSNGSALLVGDKNTPRFGDALGRFLAQNKVTYFSTVPTLLSTINEPVPALRLLVLSGEVCPQELINRWARPGLRILNVYGPTEATVNTTAAECAAGRPITIGRPLRGYDLHILDEQMRPAPSGEKGELYISGETLARGYLRQPALTAERFVRAEGESGQESARLYRTGDLVRRNSDGELEYFGRVDGQIKVRGYRVELAEIEAVLLENERIQSASVRLFDQGGLQALAAYVVTADPADKLDRNEILSRLEARLPSYMIPGTLDVVDELPMLASGKVDRSRLPAPVAPLVRAGETIEKPGSELEATIAAVWEEVLRLPPISVSADFFRDLGGHSLTAAQMVTILRRETAREVNLRDVYDFPTVRALAARLALRRERAAPDGDGDQRGRSVAPSSRAVFESMPRWIRLSTAALQGLSIYFFHCLGLAPIAVIFLLVLGWFYDRVPFFDLVGVVLLMAFFMWPVMLTLSVLAKWILIGRYKPGKYPLWGWYYFRFWLASRFQGLSGVGGLVGTPFMPLYCRLMGAKVGRRCTLASALCATWDLCSIGDDTSIGADTQYLGYRVENGMLVLGRVDIGSRCFIGLHSALGLNVRMGDDARLDDQSLLPDGQTISPGESWRGSPAKPGVVPVPEGDPRRASSLRRAGFAAAHFALLYPVGILLSIPGLAMLIGILVLLFKGEIGLGIAALCAGPPVGVFVYCLYVAALKRLILNRAKPGVYPVESVFYLRKWLSDGLMKSCRAAFLPLYTTLYLPPWLRLLGAKIGPRAELSTVWNFAPELIDVGEESFFADGSIIGGKRIFRGSFEVGKNTIGRRSFVGNSAILPVGGGLGDRCLLGVQSIPPAGEPRTEDGTEWLGSPAFALPNRPKVGGFNETVTFRPTRRLYIERGIIDALRILIPGYIALFAFVAGILALYFSFIWLGVGAMLALAPIFAITLEIGCVLAVVALKKLVMGTYQPVIKPLWSRYVWLNEMVNGAYESVMAPALVQLLGTPFVAPFLRLIGCKIGRHVYIGTTLFSEFDMVNVGSYAALNGGAVIQNHLFEDRVMKSSRLTIGDECSVGNMAVILYDSEMQAGASVGPLSLLMKGETLAPRGRFHGIPTVEIDAPG